MKIVWRRRAEQQLQDQLAYIRKRNRRAAERMQDRVDQHLSKLGRFPYLGRPSRDPGARELVIGGTPFIAVYQVDERAVTILRFFHGSQQR